MGRRLIAALTTVLAVGFIGSAVAHAARGDVSVAATFNGQDIADASTTTPVLLEPGTLSKVVLDVTNQGREAIVVKRVELSGDILGLTFYKYVASTELTVEPGTTGKLSYQVDLTDLDHQATGLIRADLKVTDDTGRIITTIPTVTDVRGSLWSVTGLFGLALIVFTALALLSVVLAVARHRLPANRGQRGLRFLIPGIGIGLVVGFTASILRLWAPASAVWFAAAGILAFVFFAVGYFSPMPGDEEEDYFFEGADDDQYTDNYQFAHTTDGYTEGQRTTGHTEGLSTDDHRHDLSTDDHAAGDRITDDRVAEDQSTEVDELDTSGVRRRDALPVGNAAKPATGETGA